jgi:D-glycero-alpha-D-manno-heptose-7-phosphate kinase
MIISKTPFRISFVGGGSDLRDFYKNGFGAVLSTSIDKYVYLYLHKYFQENCTILKYSKTEEIKHNDEIKHNIIREVFRYFNTTNVDFGSISDIPGGTGMGSSSAFTSGLINLCATYNGITLTKNEIAKIACHIEIDILGEPIGKQDQFGCSIGGLNLIKFHSNEKVSIELVNMTFDNQNLLEENLFLYYTNLTRSASSILTSQKIRTSTDKSIIKNLEIMTEMAIKLKIELEDGNIDIMGDYLHEAWLRKKEISDNITNLDIDNLYNKGIKSGATGGKLLGAGGGGFILFYVPKKNKELFLELMKEDRELKFKFDNEGTSIIFNNK